MKEPIQHSQKRIIRNTQEAGSAASFQPLMERLKDRLPALTGGQRKVAELLAREPELAAFASAQRVAARAGVSQATVSRACRALGFPGYTQLQEVVRGLLVTGRTLERYYEAVQRERSRQPSAAVDVFKQVLLHDIENLRRTLERLSERDVQRAVALLSRAGHIFVAGAAASYGTACFLTYNLQSLLRSVTLIQPGLDFFHQLRAIDRHSALVAIGFPRYTETTLRLLHYARSRGAATVAVTDSPASPLATLADAVLTASIATPAATDSHTAALSLVTALLTALALHRNEEVHTNAAHFEAARAEWQGSEPLFRPRHR